MKFFQFRVTLHEMMTDDIHLIRVISHDHTSFSFLPGQYVSMRNPQYQKPEEDHIFSIASAPKNSFLEFCIREYGNWTQALQHLKVGDVLEVSEARGKFLFDTSITHAVFLCGGVGISPIISILRSLSQDNSHVNITLLYGSRTPDSIVYGDEIEKLKKSFSGFKVRHIFSEHNTGKPWKGYHGFITKEIIQKEAPLSNNLHWFITGPPIFIQKMQDILDVLEVKKTYIHVEKI